MESPLASCYRVNRVLCATMMISLALVREASEYDMMEDAGDRMDGCVGSDATMLQLWDRV